jgi:hypothetical protein
MATETKTTETSGRNQLSKIIGIQIPTQRVRNNLTNRGINSAVFAATNEIKELDNIGTVSESTKEMLERAMVLMKKPGDDEISVLNTVLSGTKSKIKALDTDVARRIMLKYLTSLGLRSGEDAIAAVAATANYIISSLADHGTEMLEKSSMKTLKEYHVNTPEIRKLDLWPLIANLPCVKEGGEMYLHRIALLEWKKEVKKIKDKSKRDEKKGREDAESAKKKYKKPTKEAVLPEKPEVKEVDIESLDKHCKDFKHHVNIIVRTIVKKKVDGDVSEGIRIFFSRLVFELCARYVPLIKIQTKYSGAKTVKAGTITTINNMIMVDAGVDVTAFNAYVDAAIEKCRKHLSKSKTSTLEDEAKPAKGK